MVDIEYLIKQKLKVEVNLVQKPPGLPAKAVLWSDTNLKSGFAKLRGHETESFGISEQKKTLRAYSK